MRPRHGVIAAVDRSPPWRDLALLLILLCALLGAAHILVRTSSHGVAIGADSTTYLSTAENLIAGQGLQDYRGPIPWWVAPGFPLLLAAVGIVAGVEPSEAARMVNAAAFGLTVLLAGLWLRRTLNSRLLAVGTTLVVASSHYLSHFASYAMTETTFILFALLATLRMEPFLNFYARGVPSRTPAEGSCMRGAGPSRTPAEGSSHARGAPSRTPAEGSQNLKWSSLVLAAAFSGLAAITRYAGVAVVLAGVLLLLARRETPLLSRLKQAAAYGALSIAPLAALLMINGSALGASPHKTGQSAFDSMRQIAQVAERVVVPGNAPDWTAPVLWAAAALLALVSAAICVRAAFRRRGGLPGASPAVPVGVFCLTYLIFVVAFVPRISGTHFWSDPRYLLPLYVPLLLLAAFFLDRFLRLRTAGWMTALKWMAIAVMLVSALASHLLRVRTSADLTLLALESGYKGKSYNTTHWDASETLSWLQENLGEGACRANRYGLLHARFGLETGAAVRGKYLNLPGSMKALTRWLENASDGTLVVWLHDGEDWYEYDHRDLSSLPRLALAAELSDGVVFRVLSFGA